MTTYVLSTSEPAAICGLALALISRPIEILFAWLRVARPTILSNLAGIPVCGGCILQGQGRRFQDKLDEEKKGFASRSSVAAAAVHPEKTWRTGRSRRLLTFSPLCYEEVHVEQQYRVLCCLQLSGEGKMKMKSNSNLHAASVCSYPSHDPRTLPVYELPVLS